jgi:hypothetical protein
MKKNMKRINRKHLIDELETLRMGFRTAHDFIAKTQCEKITMRASHFFANSLVAKYGGEKIEDIEKAQNGHKQKETHMHVKKLISVLQKEVKPADREKAEIEFWIGERSFEIKSMKGFSLSPEIIIELEEVTKPVLQPMVFKNEHKEKITKIEKKIKKSLLGE